MEAASNTPSSGSLGPRYWKLFTATVVSNLGDGVGFFAYPWLASAVTRNALLTGLIVAGARLPWLLFSIPAGVLTDRVNRRNAMVAMDVTRGVITVGVAIAVLGKQSTLPAPDDVESVVGTNVPLYAMLLTATVLLGTAEVLRDNCNQTLLPDLVSANHLEKANGRIWSAESAANQFIGPPFGALLIGIGFALPFFVDAASFFFAAGLVALIPGAFRARRDAAEPQLGWRAEAREGIRWLRRDPLLWPMAKMLGLINLALTMSTSGFVLYAQEVMNIGPGRYSVIGFGGAFGAIVGGVVAAKLSSRFGSGACLSTVLVTASANALIIALVPFWPVVALALFSATLGGTLWNVITVSLRQTIIPSHLLGRVNSVYRFLAWGSMPIGAVLGGVLVITCETFTSRNIALRSVWFADAAIHLTLFLYIRNRLTTERIEAARAAAVQTAAG